MLNPNAVFVLEPDSTIFVDGEGEQTAQRVAVRDWSINIRMPHRNGRGYKATGATGDVYIPKDAVEEIITTKKLEGKAQPA